VVGVGDVDEVMFHGLAIGPGGLEEQPHKAQHRKEAQGRVLHFPFMACGAVIAYCGSG
jgi:hypothetical protein